MSRRLLQAVHSILTDLPTFSNDETRAAIVQQLTALEFDVFVSSRPQRSNRQLAVTLSLGGGDSLNAVNRPFGYARTDVDVTVYGKSNPSRSGAGQAMDLSELIMGHLVQLRYTRAGVVVADCTEVNRPTQLDSGPSNASDDWTTIIPSSIECVHSVIRGDTVSNLEE